MTACWTHFPNPFSWPAFPCGACGGWNCFPGVPLASLDFRPCENGLIRENWVLVDLLHVYRQIGVDVLARMREFNKARRGIAQ